MESKMTSNMKSSVNIHRDFIDEVLKADADAQRDAYIDDAGFTLRVMDALPSATSMSTVRTSRASRTSRTSRTSLSPTKRFSIIFGMAMVAAIIATVFLSSDNLLIDASMDVATDTITPSVIALIMITFVTSVVSVSAILGKR